MAPVRQLGGHPVVLDDLRLNLRVRHTTATSVIYRMDPKTQRSRKTKLEPAAAAASTATQRAAEPEEPEQPAVRNNSMKLLAYVALQHFRKTFSRSSYYSICNLVAELP